MHTASMDEARTAEAVMSSGLVGRRVTRVLLDYAVTLQFWLNGEQTIEIKLEAPFDIANVDGSRLTVNPGDLADAARQVAELHARTVSDIAIHPGNELRIGLDDGRVIPRPGGRQLRVMVLRDGRRDDGDLHAQRWVVALGATAGVEAGLVAQRAPMSLEAEFDLRAVRKVGNLPGDLMSERPQLARRDGAARTIGYCGGFEA